MADFKYLLIIPLQILFDIIFSTKRIPNIASVQNFLYFSKMNSKMRNLMWKTLKKSFKEDQREPSIGIGFMLLWCLHSTARSVCCFYFFLECRNGTDNDCFRTGRDGWTRLIADNWQIFVRLTRQPY